MKRSLFLSFFLIFLLVSCNSPYRRVKGDGFSIRVLKSMRSYKGQMLNNALLEYADTKMDLNLVVERDTLNTSSLDSAQKVLVDYFIKPDILESTYKVFPLRHHRGEHIEAVTVEENSDGSITQLYWTIGLFPGKNNTYYIVWVWTNRIHRPDNEYIMKKMINSFKVLDK